MRSRPFAILRHQRQTDSHWDWLFDFFEDEVYSLWTFRSRAISSDCFRSSKPFVVDFKPLPAHRKLYLSYQGELSNGRGFVTQIAQGQWHLAGSDGLGPSLYRPMIHMSLTGQFIEGDLSIYRYGDTYARGYFRPSSDSRDLA